VPEEFLEGMEPLANAPEAAVASMPGSSVGDPPR
jgi:hypothetical protein